MNPETCSANPLPSSSVPPGTRSLPARAGDDAGPAVPPPAAADQFPVVDAALALRTVMLLQRLLEKVMGERAVEENDRPAGPRRSYTPRSDIPLTGLATTACMPTRLRRSSLHFSCPCCGRETVVVRRQAGHRIRCPHCDSAVAVPHPSRRRGALNMERDVESMLRPQTFVPAVRPMAPRWVRMIAKEPVLILAMAALVPFTILLMIEVPQALDQSGRLPTTVAQAAPEAARGPADGAADRAVALVQRYLAAPTLLAKAAYVRDPQRVAPLMASLAAREPERMSPVTGVDVKAAGLSHYADPANPVPVTPVVARLADGTSRTFFVEHSAEGDAIEWESSTGYSEPFQRVRAARGQAAGLAQALWRVEAAPDDYFNRSFADADGLICLKLTRPDRPDEVFWAYAPKDGEVGETLRRIWNEAPREFAQRLTITVEAGPSADVTRQVRLAAVHHPGWRTPDRSGSLVAGTR